MSAGVWKMNVVLFSHEHLDVYIHILVMES